jgi:hypothetical protein
MSPFLPAMAWDQWISQSVSTAMSSMRSEWEGHRLPTSPSIAALGDPTEKTTVK